MAFPGPSRPTAARSPADLAAVLVAVLLAVGCAADAASDGSSDRGDGGPAWSAPPVVTVGSQTMGGASLGSRPATVAVIGDSLTVASTEELDEALTRLGLDVLVIEAQVGRRMTVGGDDQRQPGAAVAETLRQQVAPELWVIALGTNDVGQYSDPGELAAQIELVLDRIPPDAPVVWVDTWIRGRPEESARLNAAIRSVVERRPASTVVAWSAHAPGDGVLSGDGVHLTTEVGTQRFATAVAAGVERLIGPAR